MQAISLQTTNVETCKQTFTYTILVYAQPNRRSLARWWITIYRIISSRMGCVCSRPQSLLITAALARFVGLVHMHDWWLSKCLTWPLRFICSKHIYKVVVEWVPTNGYLLAATRTRTRLRARSTELPRRRRRRRRLLCPRPPTNPLPCLHGLHDLSVTTLIIFQLQS
jgi:hypothetical protein